MFLKNASIWKKKNSSTKTIWTLYCLVQHYKTNLPQKILPCRRILKVSALESMAGALSYMYFIIQSLHLHKKSVSPQRSQSGCSSLPIKLSADFNGGTRKWFDWPLLKPAPTPPTEYIFLYNLLICIVLMLSFYLILFYSVGAAVTVGLDIM